MLKLAAEPVENRHEVIAYALYACFAETADVFAVILDKLRCLLVAELDVLRHRNAFHDLKFKTVCLSLLLYGIYACLAPYAAGLDIVNRRNDACHERYLTYFGQRDRIVIAIPAKCHFHIFSTASFAFL